MSSMVIASRECIQLELVPPQPLSSQAKQRTGSDKIPVQALWSSHHVPLKGSHTHHIIGDGHQPNSRGLYTHYKAIRIPIKGGMTIPNIATFHHGTFHRIQQYDMLIYMLLFYS